MNRINCQYIFDRNETTNDRMMQNHNFTMMKNETIQKVIEHKFDDFENDQKQVNKNHSNEMNNNAVEIQNKSHSIEVKYDGGQDQNDEVKIQNPTNAKHSFNKKITPKVNETNNVGNSEIKEFDSFGKLSEKKYKESSPNLTDNNLSHSQEPFAQKSKIDFENSSQLEKSICQSSQNLKNQNFRNCPKSVNENANKSINHFDNKNHAKSVQTNSQTKDPNLNNKKAVLLDFDFLDEKDINNNYHFSKITDKNYCKLIEIKHDQNNQDFEQNEFSQEQENKNKANETKQNKYIIKTNSLSSLNQNQHYQQTNMYHFHASNHQTPNPLNLKTRFYHFHN